MSVSAAVIDAEIAAAQLDANGVANTGIIDTGYGPTSS
jgi:hypothetical protein